MNVTSLHLCSEYDNVPHAHATSLVSNNLPFGSNFDDRSSHGYSALEGAVEAPLFEKREGDAFNSLIGPLRLPGGHESSDFCKLGSCEHGFSRRLVPK